MSKIIIIGVGEGGYHMASNIKRDTTAEVLKNAKYIFVDQDRYHNRLNVKDGDGGCTYINLTDIDTDKEVSFDFFHDIERVFIVAGMGGKTGTKWVSIIAENAKRIGIKSVTAIVTEPFGFEGMKKMAKAHEGIAKISETKIDRLISIKDEELFKYCSGLTFFNAFDFADKAVLEVIEKMTKGLEPKVSAKTMTTVRVDIQSEENKNEENNNMDKVAPKGFGKLDMVIAFDTTGSMAAYIEDVRAQVTDMIPRLFNDNEDLHLGIVAFGDYCDMVNCNTFGNAYQCIPLTDNENDIIKFIKESKNSSGGDGDEFYELVLKKIIDESPWRDDSSKAILLIADADPHEIGYTYNDYVVGNQIDWKNEARKAAEMKIKIDTVSICRRPWYKELSAMTNGLTVPFKSSGKTGAMIETATTARSAMAFAEYARKSEDDSVRDFCEKRVFGLRGKLSRMFSSCNDVELNDIRDSYSKEMDETNDK